MKLPSLSAIRRHRHRTPWPIRLVVAGLLALAVTVVLVSNRWLSDHYTETTRTQAELSLALYSGNLQAELQRTSIVPLLLARDPEIHKALLDHDFSTTSRRLMQVQSEIGVAQILLLDGDGHAVGATNRTLIGASFRNADPYVQAQRTHDTVFSVSPRKGGGYDFTYSRVVEDQGKVIGVIVVSADLMRFERAWSGLQDIVLVTDSKGTVLMAPER